MQYAMQGEEESMQCKEKSKVCNASREQNMQCREKSSVCNAGREERKVCNIAVCNARREEAAVSHADYCAASSTLVEASMYNVQCCSQNLLGVHNVHMGH